MSSAEAPDPTQGNSAFGSAPFQAMHKPVALVASPKEGRIDETRWHHPWATILTGPQAFRAAWSSRESHPPCACLGRAAAAGLEGQPWGCGPGTVGFPVLPFGCFQRRHSVAGMVAHGGHTEVVQQQPLK